MDCADGQLSALAEVLQWVGGRQDISAAFAATVAKPQALLPWLTALTRALRFNYSNQSTGWCRCINPIPPAAAAIVPAAAGAAGAAAASLCDGPWQLPCLAVLLCTVLSYAVSRAAPSIMPPIACAPYSHACRRIAGGTQCLLAHTPR